MKDVTVAEVAPLWPESVAADSRAAALVSLAQKKIIARVPTIPKRIDSGELDRDLLIGAVADVALRRLTEPEDSAKGVSYGSMDYTYSRQYDTSSRLWVSDADLVDLLPPAKAGGSAVIGQFGVGLHSWQVPRW